MSSYQLSERFDIYTALFYGLVVPVYRTATAIDAECKVLRSVLPGLLFALALIAKVLGLLAVVVAVVAVVASVPVQFWLCLGGLVVGAYASYPRKVVRK